MKWKGYGEEQSIRRVEKSMQGLQISADKPNVTAERVYKGYRGEKSMTAFQSGTEYRYAIAEE
jgi:hypothetical protein